jgi:hypothetical protein
VNMSAEQIRGLDRARTVVIDHPRWHFGAAWAVSACLRGWFR